MVEEVKKALRVVDDDFDSEIQMLIDGCVENMEHLGITVEIDEQTGLPVSAQVKLAIVAFAKWRFGSNDEKDQWRQIYDRQIAEMQMMSGLTRWNAEG